MNKSERGQVLVLIILTSVVLFGFAALAVDGGRVYAEKRRAQNAADAAALAAAYAALDNRNWSTAAMGQVQANDFADTDPTEDDTTPMDVHIHNPPISGPYRGNNEYYQVFIRSKVDAVFSQFVYNGALEVTVEAVAHGRKTSSVVPGQALVATDEKSCEAMLFSGGGTTEIHGGGVFSNSDGTAKNGNCYGLQQNGSGSVTVYDGGISTVGPYNKGGTSGVVTPAEVVENISSANIPDLGIPDCSHLPIKGSFTNTGQGVETIVPGKYSQIKIVGGKVTMDPGMYCLTGDFVVGGGAELIGRGIFIVMLDGSLNFQGGGRIDLTYSSDIMDGTPKQWGGMLIYMPTNNTGTINIGGGANSDYSGTIMAPGPSANGSPKCDIYGSTGTIGINSNVICNTIMIHGTASFNITFKPNGNYKVPPMVDLSQ